MMFQLRRPIGRGTNVFHLLVTALVLWDNRGVDATSIKGELGMAAWASGLESSEVEQIASIARSHGVSLLHAIADQGKASEAQILERLAAALGLDAIYRGPDVVDLGAIAAVPASLAIRHTVMPLSLDRDRLRIAVSDPFDWRGWDALADFVPLQIERVLAPREVIADLQRRYYGLGAETVERLTLDRPEGERDREGDADLSMIATDEDAANEPTVVNLVNRILCEAIYAGATDVHLEPYDTKFRVRYRIDGMLEDVPIPASTLMLKRAIVSRIKIMASLDITERRLPQDGRARARVREEEYDLRVSVLPGVYGEAVNIRLQRRRILGLDLTRLGFSEEQTRTIDRIIKRPHGLVLVTGPTGSGKTTTLYSCLARINSPETKVITIEDPVEYWMDNVLQMQVHAEIGFDFSRALRSMLRHDPDVMLIGEIRDRETADISVRAALTGHLVFATLHTNDAPTTIVRLTDIGIEPFLIASSLCGVVSQRLLRATCESCKAPTSPEGFPEVLQAWSGRGCEACRHTGYRGRFVIGELLEVGTEIRDAIQTGETSAKLRRIAIDRGMRTLRDSAGMAVASGRTSPQEAARVTLWAQQE